MTRLDNGILLHLAHDLHARPGGGHVITFDDEFTLHDLTEVAQALGADRVRIEQAVRSGSLAAVHHAGRWMVASEEVERFRGSYEPPVVRPRTVGTPRRFIPPPRPAEVPEAG